MCSSKAPPPPAPLAAAPRLPNQVDRGTKRNKKPNQNIVTSSRGIYQDIGGKDLLGQ